MKGGQVATPPPGHCVMSHESRKLTTPSQQCGRIELLLLLLTSLQQLHRLVYVSFLSRLWMSVISTRFGYFSLTYNWVCVTSSYAPTYVCLYLCVGRPTHITTPPITFISLLQQLLHRQTYMVYIHTCTPTFMIRQCFFLLPSLRTTTRIIVGGRPDDAFI